MAERVARGKAARAEVPRSAHAEFAPGPDRPDPVALLEGQAATRVPELVPIRYGRMLVSPFTFYRGAALIMASDLATDADHRACASSSAATPTCRTSASSAAPSGAWSSTSTTSTRPCRGRSSGTSSGWRRASRWPAATGASPTPSATRSSGPASRSYREAMADFAGRDQPRGLLRAPRRGGDGRPLPGHRPAQGPQARREGRWPRRAPRTACRRSTGSPTRWTASRASRADPPLIVPVADLLPDERAAEFARVGPRPPARVPAHPGDRPAPAARALPLRRPRPQGRGGGQRRARAPGSP